MLDFLTRRAAVSEAISSYSWLNSEQSNRAPSLRPFWLTSYLESYCRGRSLLVPSVAGNRVGEHLLAPLIRTGRTSAEFLLQRTADYCDMFTGPMVDDLSLVELLTHVLNELHKLNVQELVLERLPNDSPTQRALQACSRRQGYLYIEDICDQLPYINLRECPNRSQSHRLAEYYRKGDRLANSGRALFAMNTLPKDLDLILADARAAHIARWKKLGIRSAWSTAQREKFISNVCVEAQKLSVLFIPTLWIDGRFAAMRLCFDFGDRIYEWMTAFNLEFSRWSPGHVLLGASLEWIYENRPQAQTYELLRGREHWKQSWADGVRSSKRVTLRLQREL